VAKIDHVAVEDDVVLALEPKLGMIAARGERAPSQQVLVAADFRADEAALDVSMNLAGRVLCVRAARDRARPVAERQSLFEQRTAALKDLVFLRQVGRGTRFFSDRARAGSQHAKSAHPSTPNGANIKRKSKRLCILALTGQGPPPTIAVDFYGAKWSR
jgi:hypothetical protein